MPAPIDIASRPPVRTPKSNLTSQLRAAGGVGMASPSNESYSGRTSSISQNMGIPMSSSRLRRESMAGNDLAKSLMSGGGMSWGGVSVGSWIRDDIIMTGTSPFTFQSPSYHSSSYLPKLEAEFCRDFSCCGIQLPSLHDLLRHYEELHAQQMPTGNDVSSELEPHDSNRQQRHVQQQNTPGMSNPIGGIGGIQYEMMRQQQMQRQQRQEEGQNQDDHQEGEITGDMDMDDDDMTPPPNPTQLQAAPTTQSHPGQQHMAQAPMQGGLNHPPYHAVGNMSNAQMPGLISQPTHFSPESSVPGTPLANEQLEYTFSNNMAYQTVQTTGFGGGLDFGNLGLPGGDMSLDMCIDEPAKRLFNTGGVYSQAQLQQLMNNGGPDVARRLREEGMMQQQPQTMPAALMQHEDKPFKCPVVGCEKAYKNQNGLKYHKQHGHINQQLHDNSDGTFSIVNPETSAPYPGTLGMEKEKPYRCEFCGKRYKNLNGLKYHRSHSSHPQQVPAQTQQPIPGGVVAVAGGLDGGMKLI